MTSTSNPSFDLQNRLQWALLILRITVFIVMFVWILDKFFHPEHTMKVLKGFYNIDNFSETIIYLLGAIQSLLMLLFLAGIKKTVTYGIVLILHTISTLAAYNLYIDIFNNLLFFAAWPMLGACITLYLLRTADTKFSF
ncbi:hypothetical protein WN093_16690 [Gammaproteobacteria bacterium AS21]|jgi:hypothetical protein